MNAPRYEIRTVADFLNVPEDRREVCIREFGVWLELVGNLKVMFEGIEFAEDPAGKFIWVDDDKGTATVAIKAGEETVWKMEGRI